MNHIAGSSGRHKQEKNTSADEGGSAFHTGKKTGLLNGVYSPHLSQRQRRTTEWGARAEGNCERGKKEIRREEEKQDGENWDNSNCLLLRVNKGYGELNPIQRRGRGKRAVSARKRPDGDRE